MRKKKNQPNNVLPYLLCVLLDRVVRVSIKLLNREVAVGRNLAQLCREQTKVLAEVVRDLFHCLLGSNHKYFLGVQLENRLDGLLGQHAKVHVVHELVGDLARGAALDHAQQELAKVVLNKRGGLFRPFLNKIKK